MVASELHLLLPELPDSERLVRWAKAFHEWLASLYTAHGSASRSQAFHAWELLLQFHPSCPPWDLDRDRLASFTLHLARTGYKPSTVRSYQGRISAFFRYCSKRPELTSTETLFGPSAKPFNPIRGVPKPDETNYQRAYILRPFEARALLRSVDRQSSLIARRDYAILLTLLLTGLTQDQLRHLRWGHLDFTPTAVLLNAASPLPGKEIPPIAWDAILDHLRSSGRFGALHPSHYLFAALADPLLHPPTGSPDDWRSDHPLSREQMYAFLKTYSAWAGLDSSKVTFACLRHTAAALYLDTGADASALMKFLDRKYLQETRHYIGLLGVMLSRRKRRSPRFIPGQDQPARGPYQRKRPYGQPGNQNAIRHGFYSHALPETTPEQAQAAANASLEDEIIAIRLLLQRAIRLAERTSDPADAMRMLDIFGRTSERLSRLLRAQQKQHLDLKNEVLSSAISEAIAEITQEWGLDRLDEPPSGDR
jgi:integrase